MVNDPDLGFGKNTIPTTKQISSKRSRTLALGNASTSGESPEELHNLARTMIRPDRPAAAALWVDWENTRLTATETVPITCDWLLQAFTKFVTKGVSANQGKPRFLKLVSDFTHQQTKHGLKKGCLRAVGTHFKNGHWGCTVVPAMHVVCHQETTSVLSHLVRRRH